jgi:predicted helicase
MTFEVYLRSLQKNLQKGSERTHYPALKTLLEHSSEQIEASIEDKEIKAGIPDFTVRKRDLLIGYVEAKDIGIDLSTVEKTEQLERYRESHIGANFILTNYLEFRWYINGKLRLKTSLGEKINHQLQLTDIEQTQKLVEGFLNYQGEIINNPEDLAKQMARLTKAICYAVIEALNIETETGELHQIKKGFQEVLLPDLDQSNFADMYAQTIAYGLFTARVSHAQNPQTYAFERRIAGLYILDTNPFLKRLFNTIFDTDAISQIHWAVDDLVQLLAQVNMTNILENFGKNTRQEDPVVHFYETFLADYDAAMRKSRGVYYTPEPVVSFMVRSVDLILKNRFNLPLGLADYTPDQTTEQPRVQILDPATGTGTFLYSVVNQIYQNLDKIGLASCWNDYVKDHLFNRLYGFELLMAPYAIAHLKLGLLLQHYGYQFQAKQRLGIYLTNTLDEALKKSSLLFGQYVAQEANEAAAIKRDLPIMVVLGNPPYSVSSQNSSKRQRIAQGNEQYLADIQYTGAVWDKLFKTAKPGQKITELTAIGELLERYKGRVRLEAEKNIQPLDDDYIKFICFAHHRIEKTGYGIVAFITNHSYLGGLIHRGMREELLKTFDEIYILDLHGNSLLKEKCPDGSLDQNVFDIQQGVGIIIAIKNYPNPFKNNNLATVFHDKLWGNRQEKYNFLNQSNIESVQWQTLQVTTPNYFFIPKNFNLNEEYEQLLNLSDIFPVYSSGIETGKDEVLIKNFKDEIQEVIQDFSHPSFNENQVYEKYKIRDTSGWRFSSNRSLLIQEGYNKNLVTLINYRPFDDKFIYYHNILRRPQKEVQNNLLKDNLALLSCRQQIELGFDHIFCTNLITERCAVSLKSREVTYVFPLYIYPNTENEQYNLFTERTPNFSSKFLTEIKAKLGYIPTPEHIFYYAYAMFHSPTYRTRYAEYLKIDFPRLPLTTHEPLFRNLAQKGEELVQLHLMKSQKLNHLMTKYQGEGDNNVKEVTYKPQQQRVYIHQNRYFEGIPPEIWGFRIGGYQVLEKWLKDRKKAKRSLSFNEILHYQKIVVALTVTLNIMKEIDQLIPEWPIQ